MGNEYVFLFKMIFFGLAAFILVPKNLYRKYIIYGLLLGGAAHVLVVLIFSGLFHWYRYENLGLFNILGLFSFWSPLAWMFVLMYYLYLLPRRRLVLYPYILCFAVYAYLVGLVLENFRVFKFIGLFKYFAPLGYIVWFGLAAWIYIRQEKIELKLTEN